MMAVALQYHGHMPSRGIPSLYIGMVENWIFRLEAYKLQTANHNCGLSLKMFIKFSYRNASGGKLLD